MEDWNPVKQAFCNACFDKQHYDIYLKVKDLPDDVMVKFDINNLEGEYLCTTTMSVGRIKKWGKKSEERNAGKTE